MPSGQATLTRDATLVLNPVQVVRHGKDAPLLGCPSVRRFLEVDDDSLLAVAELQHGGPLKEVEARLKARTGTDYDLLEFVQILLSRGFVATVDGSPTEAGVAAKSHGVLGKITPAQVSWLVSWPVLIAVVAVVLAWLTAVVVHPQLFPRPSDLRFVDRPLLVLAASFSSFLAMAYLHELAHYFVARAHGVDARISFSHRMYIVVLQTDVTNAWQLPPRKRIQIFLAGPSFNLLMIGVAGLIQAMGIVGVVDLSAETVAALRFLCYVNFFPLLFQLMIFGRTDLYFVLLTALREKNLAADSRRFVLYRIRRIWLLVRRKFEGSCEACGAKTMADDPYCSRCGIVRNVLDPNKWPFSYAARHRLLTFGLFQIAGQALMMTYMLGLGLVMQFMFLQFGARIVLQGWESHDYLAMAESSLYLILLGMQVGLMLWFLVRPLLRAVGAGLGALRRRQIREIGESA